MFPAHRHAGCVQDGGIVCVFLHAHSLERRRVEAVWRGPGWDVFLAEKCGSAISSTGSMTFSKNYICSGALHLRLNVKGSLKVHTRAGLTRGSCSIWLFASDGRRDVDPDLSGDGAAEPLIYHFVWCFTFQAETEQTRRLTREPETSVWGVAQLRRAFKYGTLFRSENKGWWKQSNLIETMFFLSWVS